MITVRSFAVVVIRDIDFSCQELCTAESVWRYR